MSNMGASIYDNFVAEWAGTGSFIHYQNHSPLFKCCCIWRIFCVNCSFFFFSFFFTAEKKTFCFFFFKKQGWKVVSLCHPSINTIFDTSMYANNETKSLKKFQKQKSKMDFTEPKRSTVRLSSQSSLAWREIS